MLQKILKLKSVGGYSGSRRCKASYGGAHGGDLTEPAFGGSLESSGRFHVCAFGRNLTLIAVEISSHLISITKRFHKYFQRDLHR
jgi:hypothetical protein